MFQYFQNLMLSVLVLLVLQHLFYSYFLSILPICSEVNHPEGAFPSNSFDFILWESVVWFVFLIYWNAGFANLIRFGFQRFIMMNDFVRIDFEVTTVCSRLFGGILWVYVYELGFWINFLSLPGFVPRLLHFGDHTPVYLFVGTALLLSALVVIVQHQMLIITFIISFQSKRV